MAMVAAGSPVTRHARGVGVPGRDRFEASRRPRARPGAARTPVATRTAAPDPQANRGAFPPGARALTTNRRGVEGRLNRRQAVLATAWPVNRAAGSAQGRAVP